MTAGSSPQSTVSNRVVPFTDSEGGLELGQFVNAIRRKLPLIIGLTTVFAALAYFKALNEKPIYNAGFEILTRSVTAENEVISSVPDTLSSQKPTAETSTITETKIKVLLSPTLLYPIVDQLKVNHPEVDYFVLSQNLAIQSNGLDILSVSFTADNPDLVKDVLKVVADAYLRYSLEERQKDVRQGIVFVDEQLPKLEARVSTLQRQLQGFRQTYNLIDPELQAKQYSDQAGTLSNEQVTTQTQLDEMQLLYTQLRLELSRQSPEMAASSALNASSRYQLLLGQLLDLDTKIAQESALYLEDSPEIQLLLAQRQNLLPLLNREGVRVERSVAKQIQDLDNRNQALKKSILDLNRRIKQLSIITREFNDIQRELQIATDNLNQFLSKREGLRIDAAQRQVPWQLLTPPGDPFPSEANAKRSFILGGILGALLGVGLAIALDKLSNVIRTSKEVKDITKLPLLGVIPFNQSLPEKILASLSDEQLTILEESVSWFKNALPAMPFTSDQSSIKRQNNATFREAFRSLKANLHMISPDHPIRSLVVSSATPANGKSTIAIHLAQTAASLGQRVLLVDTDLRRPTLHHRLDLMNDKGITDAVSMNLDLSSVIQQIPDEDNLFIIPTGSLPPDPTRILSSKAMEEVVRRSQEQFDLVIFDAPPLLGLADSYFLSNYTDGILLVVRLNYLKRSLLERVLEDMRVSNVSVLGVVANASEDRTISSYGYYYQSPSPELKQKKSLFSSITQVGHQTRQVKRFIGQIRKRIGL